MKKEKNMKQLKKGIVLAVFAVVMTMMLSENAQAAGQQNTTETIVWDKNYNIEYDDGGYYSYNLNLTKKIIMIIMKY